MNKQQSKDWHPVNFKMPADLFRLIDQAIARESKEIGLPITRTGWCTRAIISWIETHEKPKDENKTDANTP